jgi:predicted O-linked N-acetylglucosamine transferase (SPINDLY family)
MMSGFIERLDRTIFETVYLRPGKAGESRTAKDWVARAGKIVEYSDADAYSAINTIADQELDILISGPSGAQIFFPLMARLAHLQMVLLEPNWPDGLRNNDYYISWQMAEPENYKDFYKTSVSLLRTPPYWIEKTSVGQTSASSDPSGNAIRQRLLGLGPQDRFYICANTQPKIHPVMDEVFRKLLDMDPAGSLVFLRGEHAMALPFKARLQKTLSRYNDKIILRRRCCPPSDLQATCI